jgi:myxalamid-type polyketide synthase MxaB
VTGLALKRTNQAVLQRSFKSRREDWLYQFAWQQKPREEPDSKLPIPTPRNWLIFADRAGVSQALMSQLAEKGETATLVFPGQECQAQDDHTIVINPDRPEDMQRLLAKDTTVWNEILYLWALDTTPNQQTTSVSLLEDQKTICGSLLHLIQALAQAQLPSSPKLWLVTQGVQPVENISSQLNVAQSPLWGLGRVIALEHPELNCKRVDLDATNIAQSVQELVAEIVPGDLEDQIAFRKGDRYVLRLIPYKTKSSSPISEGKSATADEPFQLSIYERGMFDNLVLEPASRCPPGPGEVEIRVYATGLNFRDVLDALGMCPVEAGPLGSECAGEISAIGEDVSGWHVGDEVLAIAPDAFRTFVTVPADFVALKPPNISFEEAATIPVTFLTAYYGLCRLVQMKAGDRVLIHAAAGGVGLAAIQLAQQSGAEIFATAGTPEKRAFLKSMGIEHIMNSRTLDFADEIMGATNGQGVDIVLNSLAGDFIPKSLSALGANALVEIGKIDIWDSNRMKEARPDVSYFFFDLATEGFKNPPLIREIFRQLLEAFSLGTLVPLPRQAFSVTEIVSAFRTMAQAKHIGKIVVTQEQKRSGEMLELFRPEASYLVTGGLGNLGFFVAQWMAQQGARNLVLVGRTAPSDRVCEAISALEKSGVKVLVMKADVSQEDQVREVLASIAQSMPGLRGIIHAAGVLEDGILLRQNWEQFATVLSPKVQGSWNLHVLTSHLPLDFFVMFSSTASVLGSAGQGNYAAANSFMDILAHARRLQGLPAVSINWAGWSEIGLAARQNNLERGLAFGLEAIPPDQGLHILEQVLRQEVAQIAAMSVDWQKFMQQFSLANKPPLFADFSRTGNSLQNISIGKSELYKKLEATAPQNRQQALVTFMSEQVHKVLGLKPGFLINLQRPLKELGLDSLMAIELRNSLARAFRPLPATLLLTILPWKDSLLTY